MKIYAISGLGTGRNAFNNLKISADYEFEVIDWIIPYINESIESYALRLAKPIDTSQDFVLLGVSFGGMIAQEMLNFISPKALILISTITKHSEKSIFFKSLSFSKAYRLLPIRFFTSKGSLSYYRLRSLYSKKLPDYDKYFEMKDHTYLRWSIHQCIQWKGNKKLPKVLRLNGDSDIVFPIENINKTQIINKGTHVMILTRANTLSKQINLFLKDV